MIKSNRDFAKQLAKEFNISEKDINTAMDYYFKHGKSLLENMANTDVYFYGLGTMIAKRKKIYDLLKYYAVRKEKVTANAKPSPIKDRIIAECETKINQLNILLEKYKERDTKKKQMKLEQKTTIRSIQESEGNLGRFTE